MSATVADLAGFAITMDVMDFAPAEPFPMWHPDTISSGLVDCKWRSRMELTGADVKNQPR